MPGEHVGLAIVLDCGSEGILKSCGSRRAIAVPGKNGRTPSKLTMAKASRHRHRFSFQSDRGKSFHISGFHDNNPQHASRPFYTPTPRASATIISAAVDQCLQVRDKRL